MFYDECADCYLAADPDAHFALSPSDVTLSRLFTRRLEIAELARDRLIQCCPWIIRALWRTVTLTVLVVVDKSHVVIAHTFAVVNLLIGIVA